MSFSSGSFTLVAGNPVVTGTTISSTTHNNTESDIATGLTTCLLKDGTQTVTANIPMATYKFTGLAAGSAAGDSLRYEQLFTTSAVTLLGAMNWVEGANIASAATINLTTVTGNAVHVTGTTQIDAVTLGDGMWRLVIFDGALTLTHHATNNNLPGGANITTAANDRALYWADGTTVYCVMYEPATVTGTGSTVKSASPTFTGTVNVAALTASGAISGATATGAMIATQAEQETGTATDKLVTTGLQHQHRSAVKAWGKANSVGALASSYNVTNVTDTGTGVVTYNITNAFSAVGLMNVVAMILSASNTLYAQTVLNEYATTSAIRIDAVDAGTLTQVDPAFYCMIATGDL